MRISAQSAWLAAVVVGLEKVPRVTRIHVTLKAHRANRSETHTTSRYESSYRPFSVGMSVRDSAQTKSLILLVGGDMDCVPRKFSSPIVSWIDCFPA